MKLYEAKVFKKNGVLVDSVYVVKSRDTLATIYKTMNKFGVQPETLHRINPELKGGARSGQFVYFKSNTPRFTEQEGLILNTYELERTPFTILEVDLSKDFKKQIDQKSGIEGNWSEVLVLNRVSEADLAAHKKVKLKLYSTGTAAKIATKLTQSESFDASFAKQIEVTDLVPTYKLKQTDVTGKSQPRNVAGSNSVTKMASRTPSSTAREIPWVPISLGIACIAALGFLAYKRVRRRRSGSPS